jgi:pyruvate formate lyase activating enzyme
MLIGGIVPFSLIDYPPHMACVVFTQGCNFRCPYCHNPELVTSGASGDRFLPGPFFEFLKERKGKLDAVVITGGEPTLQEGLTGFIEKINILGYAVKLDTNGTSPKILKELIRRRLVQAVAMDVKAPRERYREVTGGACDEPMLDAVTKSVQLLLKAPVEVEFRTTIVKDLVGPEDVLAVAKIIKGAARYALQRFVDSKTFDPEFKETAPFTEEELTLLRRKLQPRYVRELIIR